ncbi:Bgt-3341 [Blumeria graminis f. sp. tritici]|uniref:WD repeat-containing protein JIP5 n=2 Tax=Blumeria graminis f. sp. tritici TaxID=62690 RepID=A0A061HJD4_BLUGR|nr:hypothetical protein BGT96224_3341 [Blumeria graminis f. sp. tritici 96224]VCU41374.1 Bgt-3341 [Blumeria graminis f. sp. tritici]
MFENVWSLTLSSHLFAQSLHPTEPVLAVGLASGQVESFRLPPAEAGSDDEDDHNTSIASISSNAIDLEWRTRRHRGSCRTLAYSHDGEVLYSSGTDGLVKAASSQTGQVVSKIAIPYSAGKADAPSLVHALSPETLLLATDSAAIHVYDLRSPSIMTPRPAQTYFPHQDYISSLTPLPPSSSSKSGFSKQWISTGGTTLAVTDLRKGVLAQSADQEEELLCSTFVGGLPIRPGKSNGEKLLLGDSSGVLTLWEKGVWDDQQERIRVVNRRSEACALESIALMPQGVGDGGKNVVVGVEDGKIHIVKLGINKVTATLQHERLDGVEGVTALGFDVDGRLISGGGTIVKAWQQLASDNGSEDEEDDEGRDGGSSIDDMTSCDSDAETCVRRPSSQNDRKRKKPRVSKISSTGIMGFEGLD